MFRARKPSVVRHPPADTPHKGRTTGKRARSTLTAPSASVPSPRSSTPASQIKDSRKQRRAIEKKGAANSSGSRRRSWTQTRLQKRLHLEKISQAQARGEEDAPETKRVLLTEETESHVADSSDSVSPKDVSPQPETKTKSKSEFQNPVNHEHFEDKLDAKFWPPYQADDDDEDVVCKVREDRLINPENDPLLHAALELVSD